MDYGKYRLDLLKLFYRFQLNEFLVKRFRPDWPTIILLPGGMGSQLNRTRRPFPNEPNFFVETVWMDAGIFVGPMDARTLEIDSAQQDIDAFVVGANGPLHFLTQTPYTDFLRFAEASRWNAVVFGYDWRRPLEESADFLQLFVNGFRAGAQALSVKDPLPTTTFVCHSMGGNVIATALRRSEFSKLAFKSIVTIATPFYGTSTHHQRYYVGQDPLNGWYTKTDVTRIIGSMSGPFSLLFLPQSVFAQYGSKLGLSRYPLTDSKTGNAVDPFGSEAAPRWPSYVSQQGLKVGHAALVNLAKPIESGVLGRFFNVRSQKDKETAVELRWDDVRGSSFDPQTGANPVHPLLGPGDGTVPFWSAFHASAVNRIELQSARDHGNLLEHREVMDIVASIVAKGKAPKPSKAPARTRAPSKVSEERLSAVLESAQSRAKAGKPLPSSLFEKPVARALFSKLIW